MLMCRTNMPSAVTGSFPFFAPLHVHVWLYNESSTFISKITAFFGEQLLPQQYTMILEAIAMNLP